LGLLLGGGPVVISCILFALRWDNTYPISLAAAFIPFVVESFAFLVGLTISTVCFRSKEAWNYVPFAAVFFVYVIVQFLTSLFNLPFIWAMIPLQITMFVFYWRNYKFTVNIGSQPTVDKQYIFG